jgi:hypothetical protein
VNTFFLALNKEEADKLGLEKNAALEPVLLETGTISSIKGEHQ